MKFLAVVIFSIKSDVYSFGVLLLEIVSGRKNTSFYDDDHPLNLVGHVCKINIGKFVYLTGMGIMER